MTRKPIAAAIAALFAQSAGQAAAQTATALPSITVTASEGAIVDILDQESVRRLRQGAMEAAALLAQTPGVAGLAGGPASTLPVIRGLADERLRVTLDGADLTATCPNHMNVPLSYVAPEAIESVAVYPSITPVSVGGDAIGGAVVIERAKAPFAEAGQTIHAGEVAGLLRSNGNGKVGDWAAWYGTEHFAVRYQGGVAQSDDYTAGGPFKTYTFTGRANRQLDLDRVGSTAFLLRHHAVDLGWKSGDHEIRAEAGIHQQPYQLYANQRMDLLNNEEKRVAMRYQGNFAWGKLSAQVYHEEVDHFMDFGQDKRYWYGSASGGPNPPGGNAAPCAPISATCAAGMPMYAASSTDGVKVKATLAIEQTKQLQVGGEWNRYRLDDWWPPSGAGMWPNTFWNIRNGKRERLAAFAEWSAAVRPDWRTTFGVRVERVTTDADPVQGYANTNGMTPMLNYQLRDATSFNSRDRHRSDTNWNLVWHNAWRLSAQWHTALDLARQVRSPSLYERYPWSTWQMAALMNNFVGDGNGYIGNPDLKPETAYTVAGQIRWQQATDGQGWSLAWRPYFTRIDDYIDAVQWDAAANAPRTTKVRNNFTVLRYINQSALLYGYELTAEGPLATNAWGSWQLAASLACSRGRNDETNDRLYGIMPRQLKVRFDHALGAFSQRLTVEAVERKERVNRERNEIPTPGYALVHWSGSYALSRSAQLEFGVHNLFDRLYYPPLAGAYVGQGTTMTIPPLPNQPQWGTPVPGPGRTLWLGARVRF
jgi:iron complex outermembrane receptor protein